MTRFSPFPILITVLVLLVQACASPLSANQEHTRKSTYYTPAKRVYLCNCWVNGGMVSPSILNGSGQGAESQVAFYKDWPPGNIMNQPDFNYTMTDTYNYRWENGGMAPDVLHSTFQWWITDPMANGSTIAGYAQDGPSCYNITRGTTDTIYQTIYQTPGVESLLNCAAAYIARLAESNSTCTSLSQASTAATQTTVTAQATQIGGHAATATATASAATAQAIPITARLGISIGAAVGIILSFTTFLLVRRYRLRKRQILAMSTTSVMELHGDSKKAAFLRSASMETFSSPTSTVSELHPDFRVELHPDTIIEIADTDRGLAHVKLPPYQQELSPASTLTSGKYTVSPYQ